MGSVLLSPATKPQPLSIPAALGLPGPPVSDGCWGGWRVFDA